MLIHLKTLLELKVVNTRKLHYCSLMKVICNFLVLKIIFHIQVEKSNSFQTITMYIFIMSFVFVLPLAMHKSIDKLFFFFEVSSPFAETNIIQAVLFLLLLSYIYYIFKLILMSILEILIFVCIFIDLRNITHKK